MKRIYILSGQRHFVLKAIKSQRHEMLILYIYIYIWMIKFRHILVDSNSVDQSSSWEANRFLVKFPAFTEPGVLTPLSQHSSICPYPQPHQSIPCLHAMYWMFLLIWSYNLSLGLPNGLFTSHFSTKTLHTPLRLRTICRSHLI
jgi:hypothetical protein